MLLRRTTYRDASIAVVPDIRLRVQLYDAMAVTARDTYIVYMQHAFCVKVICAARFLPSPRPPQYTNKLYNMIVDPCGKMVPLWAII